jgi:hypothetical protein
MTSVRRLSRRPSPFRIVRSDLDLAQPTDANMIPRFWRGIVGGKTHHGAVSLTVGLS